MKNSSRVQARVELSVSQKKMNFVSGETRIEVKWRIVDEESDREVVRFEI